MKTCFTCNQQMEDFAFATHQRAKDGLQSNCRECQRRYRRQHYEANRQKYINKAKVWKTANLAANRAKLIEYFQENPCVDCGEDDLEVLEFDHRDPSLKEFNVGTALPMRQWDGLITEIAKCDVRCANCHRRKTNRQFGYWRSASITDS